MDTVLVGWSIRICWLNIQAVCFFRPFCYCFGLELEFWPLWLCLVLVGSGLHLLAGFIRLGFDSIRFGTLY
jgi:hypothetical protein